MSSIRLGLEPGTNPWHAAVDQRPTERSPPRPSGIHNDAAWPARPLRPTRRRLAEPPLDDGADPPPKPPKPVPLEVPEPTLPDVPEPRPPDVPEPDDAGFCAAPDELEDPAPEPAAADLCADPGRIRETSPVMATPATPATAVVARSRPRPRSRSATACATESRCRLCMGRSLRPGSPGRLHTSCEEAMNRGPHSLRDMTRISESGRCPSWDHGAIGPAAPGPFAPGPGPAGCRLLRWGDTGSGGNTKDQQ